MSTYRHSVETNARDIPIALAESPIPMRRALISLCLGTLLLMPSVYATQPILPLLSHEFHISAGLAGLTLTFFNVGLGVALLIAGPISDRIGRRPIIVVASAMMVIPTLLAAWAPTYPFLLAARAAQGVLASGIGAIAMAYLGDELPEQQRGAAIGWYATAQSSAAMVGRVGGGLVADVFGWHVMFLGLGILSIVGAFILANFLPLAQRFRPSNDIGLAFRQMARSYRSPLLVGGFIVGFLLGTVFGGYFTYVSYALVGPPFFLSTSMLGLIFLLYVFGFFTPLSGMLSTRYGRRFIIAICFGGMIGGIILTRIESLTIVVVGLAILITGLLSAYGVANAYISDHAGGMRGGASALYLCHWYTGGAVGAALLGPVWALAGWNGITLTCIGLAILALATLAISTALARQSQQIIP